MKMVSYDALIIGAGMSGLLAATRLTEQGLAVGLLDKGRSVGGRLATRRIGTGRADHGAQFFTVRDAAFQHYVNRWLDEDLVYEWSRGWSSGSLASTAPDGYPRYAVRGGMNALAKRVAADLDATGRAMFFLSTPVKQISREEGLWVAEDENGARYQAHSLIVTAPIPQSLALVDAGNIELGADDRNELEQIRYGPCLCGLFHIEGGVNLPPPGALQRPRETFSWIADNQAKGISPDATLLTIHANPDFSTDHYDDQAEMVLPRFRSEILPYLAEGATIREEQLKRWRYALPITLYPERFLDARGLPGLYFGGDAFGGPRVEGAALSGLAMANAIVER